MENRIHAERRVNRLAGKTELQPAINFNDRLAGAALDHCHLLLVILLSIALIGLIVRHISAANDLSLYDDWMPLAVIHPCLKLNRLAFKQTEQKTFGYGVVAIVLFQDLQTTAPRIAEHHGVRLHMRRDIAVEHMIDSRFQVQRHALAHYGEVLVVNGE